MGIENGRYADPVGGQSTTFEQGVWPIPGRPVGYRDTIEAHEDRFLPGVLAGED